MLLLDGRAIAKHIVTDLKAEVLTLPRAPKLAVMLVGSDPASQVYVNLKKQRAEEIGIRTDLRTFNETATQEELALAIDQWATDPDVDGILIQLPLPKKFDTQQLINRIPQDKDADGFLPNTQGKGFVPPVHAAVVHLLNATGQSLQGRSGSIIGNSRVFTEPLQRLLATQGLTMRLVLGKDERERYDASQDDVIVIAIGVPQWLKAGQVKDKAMVIDVGTNRLEAGIIVGDVDARSFEDKPGWLSPSPGGVGPLTVASLLANTVKACKRRISNNA